MLLFSHKVSWITNPQSLWEKNPGSINRKILHGNVERNLEIMRKIGRTSRSTFTWSSTGCGCQRCCHRHHCYCRLMRRLFPDWNESSERKERKWVILASGRQIAIPTSWQLHELTFSRVHIFEPLERQEWVSGFMAPFQRYQCSIGKELSMEIVRNIADAAMATFCIWNMDHVVI